MGACPSGHRHFQDQHFSGSGPQDSYEMPETVDTILHQARTGCRLRRLPNGLPPKNAVYYCFAAVSSATSHPVLPPSRAEKRRSPPSASIQ